MIKITYLFILLLIGNIAFCQLKLEVPIKDTTDLSNLSIEELSKLKSRYAATDMEKVINQAIEAASRNPMSLRKSPSVVSVITEEEIEKSGARDMMDVLKLIPVIEFNVDVEGAVAISIRGMWTNEGNLLMQIDGQEINETAYAGLTFGNHYPLNIIKRIEVIRGPGSAIYGGYAEYAVINIITKKGTDIKGANANVIMGQTANTYTRQDVGFQVGNKANDLTYYLSGFVGRGQRSDMNYTDAYNTTYNMANNSNLNPQFYTASLSYKNLSFKFIYDDFNTTSRDGYTQALSKAYPCDFLSYMGELKYRKKWNRKFQLEAKANYKRSVPWTFDGKPAPVDSNLYGYYKIIAKRYRSSLIATWDPAYWLNVNMGIEGFLDAGYKPDGQIFQKDSTDKIQYFNYAPFAQVFIPTRFGNFIIGARYDVSTSYGSAFNPRVGITKKVGILNFKLLYASSFRAPSIEDIQYAIHGVNLKPETSKTLEFETSVKINKDMYLSVNVFDIITKNAIRYFVRTDSVTNGDPDGYRNSDKTIGSQGFELEYKYKSSWGFLNVVYSFYTVQNKEVDSANMVSMDKSATLGTAQNKFTILASINVGKYFYISPSMNFLGKRYGYASVDSNGNGVLSLYQPQAQYNLYLGSNTLVKNVTMGIGIYNITDEKILYLQAYNSLHAPLPGLGREFELKLNYHFPIKQKKDTEK